MQKSTVDWATPKKPVEMYRTLLLSFAAAFLAALPLHAQDWLDVARADVDTLASAPYAGRGYVGGGADRAAAYLGRRYAEIGLAPVGGSYWQPFAFEADLITGTPLLVAGTDTLVLGSGFIPYPSTGSGAGERLRVVDVGHGLVLRPLGVDAYASVDAREAVVLVSAPVPDSLRAVADLPPVALSREFRMQIAAAAGARAVVFLEDTPTFGLSGFDAPLPVFEVHRDAWAGAATATFAVESIHNTQVEAVNVLGQVRGTQSPDTALVVTAHYDGLGTLGPDAFFPGANDNASGVAMLLSLASSIAAEPLPYTVVFAALAGEELGLNGAQYLAEHPPVPLEHIRFVLNFDMVASAEDGLMVFAGTDFPDEYALLTALNAQQGGGPLYARANRPNSDHWAFTERGVRAFYLLTKDGRQPYHSLRDEARTLQWDAFTHARTLAEAFLRAL